MDEAKQINLFGREVPALLVMGVVVGGLLVIISAVNLIVYALTPHTHGTVVSEARTIAPFALPRADGGTFNSAEQAGKVTLYYFGYTSCPDVCPTTMLSIRDAYRELGARAEEVDVVFITIDWENDTPEMIDYYTDAFHEDFIGLHGTAEQIEPVMAQFDVQVFRAGEDPMAPGTSITHTTSMFLVDREGQLVMRLNHSSTQAADPDYMARDIRYVLNGRINP